MTGPAWQKQIHSTTEIRPGEIWRCRERENTRMQLSVFEARGEAEQSAAADEGAKDTALLTLRPHQTCSSQLAD